MDQAALYTFLSQNRYGVVSSTADNAIPQSALVGIAVTPKLEIIFDTLRTSRKCENLIARPQCSFAIGWAGEQTLQFGGEVIAPQGPELARYQEIYFELWPDGRARRDWPGIVYLVARPHWIRYRDYDQRPAFSEEFCFSPANADSEL